MPEAEAVSYLKERGLTLHGSPGTSFHWGDVFGLTNGFALVLDIDANQPSDWGHGVLRGANIQRNGIILHPVTLANEP